MKIFVVLLIVISAASVSFAQEPRTVNLQNLNYRLYDRVLPALDQTAIKNIFDSISRLHDPEIMEYARYFTWYHQSYLDSNAGKRLQNLIDLGKKIASFQTAGLKALHKFRVGDFIFDQKQFAEGMNMMLEANRSMANAGYDKIPFAGQLLNILSVHYFQFNNFRQAINYAALAHRYQCGPLTTGAFNTWGLAYQKLGLFDSAVIKFKQVISLADSLHSAVWVSIASGNLGRTYCLNGRYREGMPLLFKDITMNRDVESTNSAISALYLADAFNRQHLADSASYYINLAKTIFLKYEKWNGEMFYRSRFGYYYYNMLYSLYKERKQFAEALKYMDTANACMERYNSQFNWQLLTASEQRTQEMEYKQSMTLFALQKRKDNLQKVLLAASLTLLAIIAGFVIGRQRMKYRREKQLAAEKENWRDLEQQKAQQQLRSAGLQLDEFVNKIAEKNELIEKIKTDLAAPAGAEVNSVQEEAYKQLLRQSSILTEEDWKLFKQLFEKVWPNFFTDLSLNYPGLTPAEIRLIALSKLDTASKNMAQMLAISQESLRKSRYRLRKKYPSLLLREE